MAKMFYTMDETKAALGKSEEEIKTLSRDGRLREFRDGPRLMFKADQVDALKGDVAAGAGDQLSLGSGDTHAPLGLMDSKTGSGTGTGIAMSVKPGDSASGVVGPQSIKDDTAAGMDVGLSGSLSGSLGGGSLAGGSMGGTGGGLPSPGSSRSFAKGGVNVFGDDSENADPMAQTHMSSPRDQISLEGVGSGSGLLDLTRETDDTSLGAALLDEISPGGKKSGSGGVVSPGSSSGSTAGLSSISEIGLPEPESAPSYSPGPVMVEARDSLAPAFAAGSIGATLVILFAGLVLINAITNSDPLVDARFQFVQSFQGKSMAIFFGAGLAITIVLFIVGVFVGKSGGKQVNA